MELVPCPLPEYVNFPPAGQMVEYSDLRHNIVENEINSQKAAILMDKLTKHSAIIRKSTSFLIIFSIVAMYAAMYLIHLQSVERHLQSSAFKMLTR